MMIEPSILSGVNVLVFALTWAAPRRIVAWNAGMVTMTGRHPGTVIGGRPEAVLGAAADALHDIADGAGVRLDGIGSVFARRQGDVLVCTMSDHEREVFIGLAAQDLRVPLRSIHLLADEALRLGVSADAALDRIRRIAWQGMALTQEVVTGAKSGQGRGAGHRKVHLPSLAASLVSIAAPEAGHVLDVTPVSVLVERGVLESALRVLLSHAIEHAGPGAALLQLHAVEYTGLLEITVSVRGQPLGASLRQFVGAGASAESDGVGLLGVRRLLRARGGARSACVGRRRGATAGSSCACQAASSRAARGRTWPELAPQRVSAAPSSFRACRTVASRTNRRPRAPNCTVSVRKRPSAAIPKQTMPSGLESLAPGPATPVTDTASAARERVRAPSAMARATASLTAPCASIMAGSTPSMSVLAALE